MLKMCTVEQETRKTSFSSLTSQNGKIKSTHKGGCSVTGPSLQGHLHFLLVQFSGHSSVYEAA